MLRRSVRSCASASCRNGANACPTDSTLASGLAERGELRHLQAGVAAGIDALERFEIHVHVEREAVVAGAAADADAHARDLPAVDIHARRVLAALGGDAEARAVGDDGALERGHEIAHAEARAADVDEWIDHELAGTVIGHLPAAIDLDHGDVAGGEHVARVGVQAQREHRRMLEQPDLVRRVLVARVGDALHLAPGGLVVDLAQPFHDGAGAGTQSPARFCVANAGSDPSRHPFLRPALLPARACSAR